MTILEMSLGGTSLIAAYLLGGVPCGLYFVIAYGAGIRRFREAMPVDSDFLNRWREGHPTLLPVTIKTCDLIEQDLLCL